MLQRRHFLLQKLVAFALEHEQLQPPPEGDFQLRRIPRLGDVFVNPAGVDGRDDRVQIGVCRGQDADDAGAQQPGALQKLGSFLPGHALVGHEDADVVLVLFEQLETRLGAGRGEDAEVIVEGAGKIFQRLFLVIDVEDGEFLVILRIAHGTAWWRLINPSHLILWPGTPA